MNSTLWELAKVIGPALVTGLLVWFTQRGKNRADENATLADAALKWSMADRAEMVKLRLELQTTREKLDEKQRELDECYEKIFELEQRISRLDPDGITRPRKL